MSALRDMKAKLDTHHIPEKVGQPVKVWLNSADKLHMLGLIHSFLNEKDNKAGRNEGHGEDHTDGNQHVH